MMLIQLTPPPNSHHQRQWNGMILGSNGRAGDRFSLLWLKDHCPSPQCLHPDTRQRQIDTFSIPEDIKAHAVAIEENGRVLKIEWAGDAHVSRFDAAFLAVSDANARAFERGRRDLGDLLDHGREERSQETLVNS